MISTEFCFSLNDSYNFFLVLSQFFDWAQLILQITYCHHFHIDVITWFITELNYVPHSILLMLTFSIMSSYNTLSFNSWLCLQVGTVYSSFSLHCSTYYLRFLTSIQNLEQSETIVKYLSKIVHTNTSLQSIAKKPLQLLFTHLTVSFLKIDVIDFYFYLRFIISRKQNNIFAFCFI